MKLLRRKRLLHALAALLAFAVFGGYLVADAIADADHGCSAESSQSSGTDDGCAMCLSCSHGGALLAFDWTVALSVAQVECDRVVAGDEHALDGPPAAIDHPPQLS